MDKQNLLHSKKFFVVAFSIFSFALGLTLAGVWFSNRANTSTAGATAITSAREGTPTLSLLPIKSSQQLLDSAQQTLDATQNAVRAVAAKVLPTVVEVDVVDVIKQQVPTEREYTMQGLGSGVIVRKTGSKVYVLTNNHVAGEADQIGIKLNDGRQFKATLVGKDPNKDLALVMFESRENIPVAELGDSDSLYVGDWVMAVGNPLGFESSVTTGIISAIGRQSLPGSQIAGFTDYIQTDAAINQGNSGGALINSHGQVIGINAWIASPSGGSIGLGFAIPINNAKKAVNDFITKGKSEYGWLGVKIGDVAPESAGNLHLKAAQGSFVYGIFKDSPAAKAGILPGDFITGINGEPVKSSNDLLMKVGNLEPGKKADLELTRYSVPMRIDVKTVTRGDEQKIANQSEKVWPGFSVVNISSDIRKQLSLKSNGGDLIISSVDKGSPAIIAGLQAGDIILQVNKQPVKSMADFYKTFNATTSREIMLNISRQDHELIIGLIR
ncbi:MAG TPA: Do family serine endopeptidase [Spirochaetia bacterium]|nr:Do family serine endopeptidase [Spirochaetia bacterium]